MQIHILHGFDSAPEARGLTVVIDVFRAFSTACYIFHRGATTIMAVSDLEFAKKLKKADPSQIIIGEREGEKLPGFDYGNSPSKMLKADFTDKTVVLTTTTGTQGLVRSHQATDIITGSFLNVSSVCEYIKSKNPSEVTLLCCNHKVSGIVEEDEYCALYIKSMLTNVPKNFEQIRNEIYNGVGKRFFLESNQMIWPREDFFLCMEKDSFNFVITAKRNNTQFATLQINR